MKTYNIVDYGVKCNCTDLQTEEIQKVIDICQQNGGGEIIIPEGIYYIGSLRLYSNMKFHLLENAILRGSRNHNDYKNFDVPSTLNYINDDYYVREWNLPPYYIYGMLCAYNEHDITIIGEKGSMFDGQDCFDERGEEHFRGPMGIILCCCKNIELKGYTFKNCSNWSHQIDSCKNVYAHHVTIEAGHDGFNFHHCDGVNVENCIICTGDDCFAGYDIEDLNVKGCYLNTSCNIMRIGGYNITFDNCTMEGPGKYPHLGKRTFHTHRVFKYYSIRPDCIRRDGESIVIKNSVIKGIPSLIQYNYGKEELMQNNLPLRSLAFENTKIEGLSTPSLVKGNGELCTITFKHCSLRLADEAMQESLFDTDEYVSVIYEDCEK